jgi:hypothetical protein
MVAAAASSSSSSVLMRADWMRDRPASAAEGASRTLPAAALLLEALLWPLRGQQARGAVKPGATAAAEVPSPRRSGVAAHLPEQ